MPYRAPTNDIRFCMRHIIGTDALAETERYAEATPETLDAVLEEAGRLCAETIAPGRRAADQQGARHTGDGVTTPDGYKAAYRALADGGWICIAADPEYGGMGLPMVAQSAVNEMLGSADMAFQLCPLLTQGQIEALAAHAPEAIRREVVPKLISGEWSGTMNLTEAQAGTDLAALRTRAEPQPDGSYKITGQKIFITWGEHDCAENISHTVLARLPDAPPGVRGISLFYVPKILPDGARNALKAISIEEKLGVHGSPTCVMAYEGATGWLIGEENKGLACMFTMMNAARLAVGVQGVSIAEAAHQHALDYAAQRKQGRPVEGETGMIVDHPDVRRMLMTQRAQTEACRALYMACAFAMDMSRAALEPDRPAWAARAALLTPIAKGFCTDLGVRAADIGVQIHGGMGYIEESGAAQFLRDSRICPIYEGTNGVQAMDLIGRKLQGDQGTAMRALWAEMQTEVAGGALLELSAPLATLLSDDRATAHMLSNAAQTDKLAGATDYQSYMGYLVAGWLLLRGARAASAMLAAGEGDAAFLKLRIAVARYFIEALLPDAHAHHARAVLGVSSLYDVTPEMLAS